jgi:hypothetical protein
MKIKLYMFSTKKKKHIWSVNHLLDLTFSILQENKIYFAKCRMNSTTGSMKLQSSMHFLNIL